MSKNGPYPSKQVCFREMFHKDKYLSLEKVILINKFANHYKTVCQQKWPTRVVVSLVSLTRPKQLASRKTLYCWMGLLFNIETCYKRNGPNSWLFSWFLSSSFDDHECAYAFISLCFGWKWNEDRFESDCFMQKRRVLLSKHK